MVRRDAELTEAGKQIQAVVRSRATPHVVIDFGILAWQRDRRVRRQLDLRIATRQRRVCEEAREGRD